MTRVAFFSALALCVVAFPGAAQRLPSPAPAGAPAPAGTPAPEPPPDNKDWFEATEPQRIVGPIYYVGTLGLGAYLVTTPAGHILLDGATPKSAPLIEASIRKLGFKPEEIKVLLITHAHFDHAGTLAAFKKLSGARVAVMAPDDRLLASGGTTDYLFASDEPFHFPPVDTDRVLKDGDTVTLGGVTLTARLTPGHTRGCTTWITTVEDGGRSYRVVFPGSTSVNPGTRFVLDPSYPGIADDYRHALDLLETLTPDIFLTAHAPACDFAAKRERAAAEGPRAFVDPDGARHGIAAAREKLETLVANESSGVSSHR